ncbi:hypothetical protein IPL68_07395 [Candidatus Saccharibacteria bacterium]|nr:MAG: hypothetical protein IPL68_07395 [Candidatus Saccharibacteria bacterium]
MSNVAVFDVAAESSGALSILHSFYDKAKNDEQHTWVFIVSKIDLQATSNIKVVKYPWVKSHGFIGCILIYS